MVVFPLPRWGVDDDQSGEPAQSIPKQPVRLVNCEMPIQLDVMPEYTLFGES